MPPLNKTTIKVAVHDGTFHADDVFAVAIMSFYLKEPFEIIRSRDPEILKDFDYCFDTGLDYNFEKKIFDHHQESFNEKRGNGITYASAGLAWKHFGEEVCGSKEITEKIDEKIIQPIDAEDNGIEIYKTTIDDVNPYSFSDYIHALNPTWRENENVSHLEQFKKAVEEAKKVLEREIFRAGQSLEGKKLVRKIYENTEDKRLIILDDEYPGWKSALEDFPEPLFVVKPNFQDNTWRVNAMRDSQHKFKNRMDLPESWGGKVGEELQKITGVSDATFCHKGRFTMGAKTKESAIALAKQALK